MVPASAAELGLLVRYDSEMTMPRMSQYQGTLLSVGVLFAGLIGIVLMVVAGHTIYRNRIARQWPLADGRIVSSRTFLQATGDPKGNAKASRAEIFFVYEVNGQQYVSSNVSYDRGIGATHPVYRATYALTYPAGTRVKVAYNPAQPSESVIETSHDPYLMFVIGAGLLVLFVGYQVWLRRNSAGDLVTSTSPVASVR